MQTSVASAAARVVDALKPGEEVRFVQNRIRAKSLHPLIADLNSDLLSKDPDRAEAARKALERIGFC